MKKTFILLVALALFSGCLKLKQEATTPEFDVTTDKQSYNLGDLVTFNISGNPDYLTLYAGEQGSNYDNRNRFTAAGVPKLQFSSARNSGAQANSLHLMVSSDFKGPGADSTATAANINAATWTDITSRATLATSATVVPSGAIDLSDFPVDKPVYIAFKYNAVTGSIQNKWTINLLTVTNTLPDGSVYTIGNLTALAVANYGVSVVFSPGWVPYKYIGPYNWVVTSGSSLVITGATTAVAATSASEAWVFCGPITLNKVANDVGVAIKETSSRLSSTTFTYKAAGTYTATFVANNGNVNGRKEAIRQVTVTVH
jgi:hypothetical protein